MNNALFLEDIQEEKLDTSNEEVRLRKLVELISVILENKDWQNLEELHFSKEKERIERKLISEAKKSPIVDREIYQLQGELKWARRYGDFRNWALELKSQLNKLQNGN